MRQGVRDGEGAGTVKGQARCTAATPLMEDSPPVMDESPFSPVVRNLLRRKYIWQNTQSRVYQRR